MDNNQEELIALLFGESPPEKWRENPEFCLYLSELGNMNVDRISGEPERISSQVQTLQHQTQGLASDNYKTFIQTSTCTADICQQFSTAESHLCEVLENLNNFKSDCSNFQNISQDISKHRRLTSLTLAKNTTLLEILELPQLMETVVRNHHYEEALQLHSYITKLCKKQPDVPILTDIQLAVTANMRLMLQQLVSQLRAPVQLPQCLKVISFLRRMDVFTEAELRMKFLQSREAWLSSVLACVPKDDAYTHFTRTMELLRVNLFDIVTQYRSIFSDDTDHVVNGETSEHQFDSRLLFTSWLSRKVHHFLKVVMTDLSSGINSFESVMGQAMYFGLSFGRVGFDFRAQLAPLFSAAIEKQFMIKLSPEAALKTASDTLSMMSLSSIPPSPKLSAMTISPPLSLLDYPPLAHVTNNILTALNEIRLVCPVSSVGKLTSSVQELLVKLTERLLDYHTTSKTGWGAAEMEGWSKLCQAVKIILLPYLQVALDAVFPPEKIHLVTGTKSNCYSLDQKLILQPISSFIPPDPVLEIEEFQKSEVDDDGSDFVKDRMGEIAAAIDKPCADDPNKDAELTSEELTEVNVIEQDKNDE